MKKLISMVISILVALTFLVPAKINTKAWYTTITGNKCFYVVNSYGVYGMDCFRWQTDYGKITFVTASQRSSDYGFLLYVERNGISRTDSYPGTVNRIYHSHWMFIRGLTLSLIVVNLSLKLGSNYMDIQYNVSVDPGGYVVIKQYKAYFE